MNVNSRLRAQIVKISVSDWIAHATKQLDAIGISSARLDAELILAHSLHCRRTWLHAHGEDEIGPHELEIANARLDLRLTHVPIAYIIGHKEFYGRRFHTTPAALIPRPDSEDIVTLVKSLPIHTELPHLLDVGTGTGCLGITIKLECPMYDVTLSDISETALELARQNAKQLHAHVHITQSDLLRNIADTFDVIVANLPYVDRVWETSPETIHEPNIALYADDEGMDLISHLLLESVKHIAPHGYLILEADPCQHTRIIDEARVCGYAHHVTRGYALALQRI